MIVVLVVLIFLVNLVALVIAALVPAFVPLALDLVGACRWLMSFLFILMISSTMSSSKAKSK